MTEQPYMEPVVSCPNDQAVAAPLADPSRPSPSPVTSTYPHLSYTATAQVPSFAYTSSSDPLLLTPISLAGSPPVHQTAKLLQHYNSPPATLSPQQPTPPATSTMHWPPQFHMGAPATRPVSPIDPENPPTSATQSHFDGAFIPSDNTREDLPEPPTLYFGHYGVSEGCKMEPDDQMPYFDIPNTGPSPLLMDQHQGEQMQQGQEMALRTPLPQDAPPLLLPSESPTLFQQPGNLGVAPVKHTRGSPYRSVTNDGSVGGQDRQGRVNKKAKQRRRVHKSQDAGTPRGSPQEAVQFKPGIPEEERFLMELRIRYQDAKGKTMWDDMRSEYVKAFNKDSDKAALQMKLSRTKQKWIQWSKRDEDILREAFFKHEKQRYNQIKALYEDMGGSKIIGFNAGNIECKLVEMGLEGVNMDPETGVRSRMKVNGRRRSTEKAEALAPQLGLHLAQPYQGMGAFPLTEEQKETLYQQVECREEAEDEGYSMEGVEEDEDDVRVKGDAQQGMGVIQRVPANLPNGHMGHFQVGQGSGGEL